MVLAWIHARVSRTIPKRGRYRWRKKEHKTWSSSEGNWKIAGEMQRRRKLSITTSATLPSNIVLVNWFYSRRRTSKLPSPARSLVIADLDHSKWKDGSGSRHTSLSCP